MVLQYRQSFCPASQARRTNYHLSLLLLLSVNVRFPPKPAMAAGTSLNALRLAKMSDDACASYFADRESIERAMSHCASDQRAAAAHTEMADRYEALAVVFGAKRRVDPRSQT